jgi:nucleoside-diphosphate-sugar epimerase
MAQDVANPPSTELELMERLTEPGEASIEDARKLEGDVLVLGAGGKIGPALGLFIHRSLLRAGSRHRVICVSRFSNASTAMMLGRAGIRTISADLLSRRDLERLPDAPYVYYLAGMKFGASGNPALAWAMNTLLPFLVAERFSASRIIALSTGNVYPFVRPETGGATEETPPDPMGEYAQSCLGRERMLDYVSQTCGTSALIVRLNYACDLRYGVPVDIAVKLQQHSPVDLSMGYFNVIWQGDLNAVLLRAASLCAAPPAILNVTGPDIARVRDAAAHMARLMDLPEPKFAGVEGQTALLSNASKCWSLFGPPSVSTETLLGWTAHWVSIGAPLLNRPTHFEERNGKF